MEVNIKGKCGEEQPILKPLIIHMETFYPRSFLKFIQIWIEIKWSHRVMGRQCPHQTSYITLINSSFKNGLDFIELLAKGSLRILSTSQLLSILWGTLYNFMGRYFWWRPDLCHQTKKNWAGAHVHTSRTGPCSWYWKALCSLLKEKGNHQHQPTRNSLTYNRSQPTRYTGIIMTQMSWKYPIYILLDLRLTPWDIT